MSAAALVSVRLRTSAETTAASLVPRMLMVTELSGAVGARDREGVGVGGAGSKLVVRRARGVGPGAGGVDGEGAVAAGSGSLRHEAGRAVDVADGERAGGGKAATLVSLRSRTSAETTAASLVPRMLMVTELSGAVGARDREGVGVGGAGRKLVVRRARGVGPGAGGVDGEGAVAAGGGGLRHEAGRAVDVADGERAGGGDVRRVGLGQIADVGGEQPRRRWCRGC